MDALVTTEILDALSAHIVVLDQAGIIRYTNQAWREFATTEGVDGLQSVGIGTDYLAVTEAAVSADEGAGQALSGIRSVLSGEQKQFEWTYPCHSPDEERWFVLRVTPLNLVGETGVVVSHENVTAAHRTADQLRLLIQHMDILVWYVKDRETLGAVSEPFARFFGLTPAQMQGRKIDELFGDTPSRHCLTGNRRVFTLGKPREMRVWLTHHSGRRVLMHVTQTPRFDASGRLMHVICTARDVTRDHEIRRELEERRRMMRAFMHAVPDLAFVLDSEGRYLEVGGIRRDLLYQQWGQLRGRRIQEVLPPEVSSAAMAAIQQCIQTHQPTTFEYGLSVGETFHFFEGRVAPMGVRDGLPMVATIITDVTERRQLNQLMLQLKEEYETVFQNTQEAMFLVDVFTDGTLRYRRLNQTHERLTGLTTAGVRGKTPVEVTGSEQGRWITSQYNRCVSERIAISYEETLELPTGRRIWFTVLSPVIEGDRVVQLVGSSRDITERKEMELALRKSERRFRLLTENARDLVYRYRLLPHIGVEYVSPSMESLLGYTPAEVYQHSSVAHLVYPEDRKKLRQLDAGEDLVVIRWVHKEGHIVWLEHQSSPIRSRSGEVIALEGIARDITERVALESRIHYLNTHDSLTGLANRAFFEAESRRLDVGENLPLTLIIGDLDALKLTNDAFGHAAGDRLLRQAADLLQDSFRSDDLIARIGGDEFAILLPRTEALVAQQIMERFQHQARSRMEGPIPLSLALGSATKTTVLEDMEQIMHQAEDNMYRAKVQQSGAVKERVRAHLLAALADIPGEGPDHIRRMQHWGRSLAQALRCSDEELRKLQRMIDMHDMGQVTLTLDIFRHGRTLETAEWHEVQRHPERGYRIAKSFPEYAEVAEEILAHHESFDGKGYPRGLAGAEIPRLARLHVVVDAFEVMTAGRPHQAPRSVEEALGELEQGAGHQFDPDMVEVFAVLVRGEMDPEPRQNSGPDGSR